MSDHRPTRVRVTAPATGRPGRIRRRTPLSAQGEIDAQTEVGLIFLRSLLRSQLRLSVGVLTMLAAVVVAIPLAIDLFPVVFSRPLLGMPLGWVLLAFGIHPLLLALGIFYVRRAERIEDAFADVIERP